MRWILPFLAALSLVAAIAAGAGAAGSGIRGRVTSSPTCPVETMPPDPNCAPRGFPARVRIYRNRTLVKRLTAAQDGRFTVNLRPATYRVAAAPPSGSGFPRCPNATKVTVRPGRYARVAIDCDSGIR